jgi:drug/metabolite transporter (DMT)-like permease
MATRFRKTVKIAPGVKMNIGKKSAGMSIGGKHGGMSFNSRSGARVRGSIPGTGLSYSSKVGGGHKSTRRGAAGPKIPVTQRWWFLVIGLALIGYAVYFFATAEISTGIFSAVVGVAMIAARIFAKKKLAEEYSTEEDQAENNDIM